MEERGLALAAARGVDVDDVLDALRVEELDDLLRVVRVEPEVILALDHLCSAIVSRDIVRAARQPTR